MHLHKTNLAVIQASRPVGTAAAVDALYVTSLLAATPKVLINVESSDYGMMQERARSCEFGALLYTTHLADIGRFEKLTGEGVTFAGADLEKIVDEVLPARFGGTGIDYQVLEEEGPDGLPKLYLLIDPDLGEMTEAEVVEFFLTELSKQSEAQKIMAVIWAQSASVRERRERPVGTRAGKVFPFHLAGDNTVKPAQRAGDAAIENIQSH